MSFYFTHEETEAQRGFCNLPKTTQLSDGGGWLQAHSLPPDSVLLSLPWARTFPFLLKSASWWISVIYSQILTEASIRHGWRKLPGLPGKGSNQWVSVEQNGSTLSICRTVQAQGGKTGEWGSPQELGWGCQWGGEKGKIRNSVGYITCERSVDTQVGL